MSSPVWIAGCPFPPLALSSNQYLLVSHSFQQIALNTFNQLYLIVSSLSTEHYKLYPTISTQSMLPCQFVLSSFTNYFPANLKFPRKFTVLFYINCTDLESQESITNIGSSSRAVSDGGSSYYGRWDCATPPTAASPSRPTQVFFIHALLVGLLGIGVWNSPSWKYSPIWGPLLLQTKPNVWRGGGRVISNPKNVIANYKHIFAIFCAKMQWRYNGLRQTVWFC